MNLIRDNAGSTAWVVGQFDEISRRMRIPSGVAGQVPPVRLVSVKANINGGVKVAIRAEAGDKAAADQLRDVVRGLHLARAAAGRREAGARESAQDHRAVGHRRDRPSVVRGVSRNASPDRATSGRPPRTRHESRNAHDPLRRLRHPRPRSDLESGIYNLKSGIYDLRSRV